MQSISFQSHVGSDGKLRLEVPLNLANRDVEVVVIVQPVESASPQRQQTEWGNGFLNHIAGGWKGEALVRDEQGAFETRDELE